LFEWIYPGRIGLKNVEDSQVAAAASWHAGNPDARQKVRFRPWRLPARIWRVRWLMHPPNPPGIS
jgi:hypothetical protein